MSPSNLCDDTGKEVAVMASCDDDPTPDCCGEWTGDLSLLSTRAYEALHELHDAITNQVGAGVGSGCLLDVARRGTLELMASVRDDCEEAWQELRPDPELPFDDNGVI